MQKCLSEQTCEPSCSVVVSIANYYLGVLLRNRDYYTRHQTSLVLASSNNGEPRICVFYNPYWKVPSTKRERTHRPAEQYIKSSAGNLSNIIHRPSIFSHTDFNSKCSSSWHSSLLLSCFSSWCKLRLPPREFLTLMRL